MIAMQCCKDLNIVVWSYRALHRASNIRCHNYKKMGHYVTQCPLKYEKGKKKHHAHVADVEEQNEEYVL
jgi:hypothetical protein